jgi:hypothetical protein
MEPVSRNRPLTAAEGPDPEQLLADTNTNIELGDSLAQGKRPRDTRSACPPTTSAALPGLTLLVLQWSLCWLAG